MNDSVVIILKGCYITGKYTVIWKIFGTVQCGYQVLSLISTYTCAHYLWWNVSHDCDLLFLLFVQGTLKHNISQARWMVILWEMELFVQQNMFPCYLTFFCSFFFLSSMALWPVFGPWPPQQSSSSEASVEVSRQIQVLQGGIVSPMPNPQPGGPFISQWLFQCSHRLDDCWPMSQGSYAKAWLEWMLY
jgi:hypothetical protein